MLRIQLIALLALSLVISKVDAEEYRSAMAVEVLSVSSKQLLRPVDFLVTLPASYDKNPDKKYVVMLDLHPRSQALLSGMHDWMSHNGGWPWLETIIVTAPNGNQEFGELKALAIEKQGNQQLLDFFEHALLPAIDKQYRTNGFRILNGFTGNAGLGLYTLINRPSLFNAYFVASPLLSQDFAYVIQDAPKKLAAMQGKSRFLLMTTSDSDFEQRQLTSFAEMEAILNKSANQTLDYHIKRFDGTYYMTQPVLATAFGIELLFNDVHQVLAVDSAISRQGASAIIEHYRYLSEQKYGFKIPATDSLIVLADSLLENNFDEAIEVYFSAIKDEPKAYTAYHALAGAYAQQGVIANAIKYEALALQIADHPYYVDQYTKQLDEYKNLTSVK